MKILDATCGGKQIWYQKNHPFVTFMDIRAGCFNPKTKDMKFRNVRMHKINPTLVADWKDIPFDDEYFDMVVFDPPHLISKRNTKLSRLQIQYGTLYIDNWKNEIKKGINELFRVLKSEGIFILKWCENCKKVDEVLKLFPYQPLFGTRTGQANNTHWIMFLKYDVNMKLDNIQT